MVSSKSENNTIRVSVKNTTNITKANASSINSSNPVNASNNQAKMYEQQALAHANTSKYWAEQSESSALKSENYAKQSELSANSILQNEKFIAVSENLDNINAVASNIEDIQNAEENATIAKEKAQESADYSELSKKWAISDELVDNIDYSSKYYAEVSKEQADIATSKTNEVIVQTEIAITKASEASQSASDSLKSAENSALSEANAKESENNAKTSETNAKESENNAKTSETNAKESENNAKTSETNAKTSEQKCQEIYDKLGVVIKLKGRVDSLEDLPTTDVVNGDAYLVGVAGLSSYPEYYWYEDHWEYMGSTEVKLEWGGITGTLSNQTDLQTALDSKISDVQANGTSIVSNGVANIPVASSTTFGLVKPVNANGIYASSSGTLNLYKVSDETLKSKKTTCAVLVNQIDLAVKTGITTNTITLTDEEKANAKEWLGFATSEDIPDISNLATKDEIPSIDGFVEYIDYAEFVENINDKVNEKQDTLTAGDNITIENGVISASGGSSGITEIKTTTPIVYEGLETSTTNISTDSNGKSYLNLNAYNATLADYLPSMPETAPNPLYDKATNFQDYRYEERACSLAFRKVTGVSGIYPILNLEGYNSILRKFEVGDIIIGDTRQTSETNTSYHLQMVFGKILDDGTFIPKLIARNFIYSSGGIAYIAILKTPSATYKTSQQQATSSQWAMEYLTNESFTDISLLNGEFVSTFCGVKFVERNSAVGINWINTDGTEYELTDTTTFDLDFNCVVYSNNVMPADDVEDSGICGFDSTKYFVANGTIDNVIVRMTDGTGTKSIGLKYNTDDFVIEDEALKINPDKIPTLPIGQIISVNVSSNYVPDGTLPCDGTEYAQAQFSDLWSNYLTGEEVTTNVQFYGFYGTGYGGSEYTLYATSTTPVKGEIYELIDGQMVLTTFEITEIGAGYISFDSGYNSIIVTATRDETLDVIKDLTTHTNLLNTCSYSDYETDLTTYGQCAKFAVDTDNQTFRVPLIKDGAVIQQALTDDELGKAYNAGLPNIEGTFKADRHTAYAPTGAFYLYDDSGATGADDTGTSNSRIHGFDASLSNSIYGNSDTVQPNAVALRYFVVVANGQTNQSMMDWSAWASSLQSKLNSDHSNDTKPYIVEMSDKSLLPSWYKIYSNGWCEQGGKQYSTSSGWIDITLLKEYTNLEYSIITSRAKPYSSSTSSTHAYVADSAAIVNYTTITTTSFQYYSQNDDGTHFTSWEAKGYIKE